MNPSEITPEAIAVRGSQGTLVTGVERLVRRR
jgi:hypothetical protein